MDGLVWLTYNCVQCKQLIMENSLTLNYNYTVDLASIRVTAVID